MRAVLPASILLALAGTGCSRRPAPAAATASVLLVTVDTLRADRLGSYGDAAARTPAPWTRSPPRASSSSTPTRRPRITLPAHASIMTGLLPPAHGVRGNGAFALGPGAADPRGGSARAGPGHRRVRRRLPAGAPLRPRARVRCTTTTRWARRPACTTSSRSAAADAVVAAARGWLRVRARPRVRVGPPLRSARALRPAAGLPRAPIPTAARSRPWMPPWAALLTAWNARPEPVAGRADRRPRRGLRRARRGEPQPLRLRRHAARAAARCAGPGWPAARRAAPPRRPRRHRAPRCLRRVGRRRAQPPRPLLRRLSRARPRAPLYAETLAPRLDFGWSDLRAWRDGRYKYIRAPRPELYDLEADPAETRDLAAARPRRRGPDEGRRSTRALGDLRRGTRAAAPPTRTPRSASAPSATCRARGEGLGRGPQGHGGRGPAHRARGRAVPRPRRGRGRLSAHRHARPANPAREPPARRCAAARGPAPRTRCPTTAR